MYSYGVYKNVRNASWQCLLDVGICELPVRVIQIANFFDVKVVKNSVCHLLQPSQYGISFVDNSDKWVIVYDDHDKLQRVRFTVAHELGHIVLGHPLYDSGNHTRMFDIKRPQVEIEADSFAARVLAPACVLWGLDLYTAEEISTACDISYTAAQYRAERMQELRARQMFLAHPLERKLYSRFSEYIQKQKTRQ